MSRSSSRIGDQERGNHIRIGKVLHAHHQRRGDVALRCSQTHHAANARVAPAKDKPQGKRGDDEKQQSENAAGADQTQNVGHVQAQPDDQQDENRQARRFVHHGLKRGGSFWGLCSDEKRDAQRDEHQQN